MKPDDRLQSINGDKLATAEQAYWALSRAFHERQPLRIEVAKRPEITLPALAPPPRSLPVHPTQIYSVIDGLTLCLLLLFFDRFHRRDGELFALLISIYPITRFIIEGLRTDEAAVLSTGMSISQNVSLLLFACAAALWFYILRRPPQLAFSAKGVVDNASAANGRRGTRPACRSALKLTRRCR